jgi:predicted RNase H-like HicB family nuclease
MELELPDFLDAKNLRPYSIHKVKRLSMRIKAIIHQAEEGGFWAEVPALPGCITEGDTMEEVLANLKDAIQGWLEVANSSQKVESSDQIVEIAV